MAREGLRHGVPRSVPMHYLNGDEPWRASAVCYEHKRLPAAAWDDDVVGRESATERDERLAPAKRVCRRECPVIDSCARDTVLGIDSGVRAGIDLRAKNAARLLRIQASRPARKGA